MDGLETDGHECFVTVHECLWTRASRENAPLELSRIDSGSGRFQRIERWKRVLANERQQSGGDTTVDKSGGVITVEE